MPRGVQHHFDDALDVTVRRLQSAYIHPKATGNGRPDLFRIQLFALDLAALENVGRQGLEDGFLPQVEPESLHMADEPALAMTDAGKSVGEPFPMPAECGQSESS